MIGKLKSEQYRIYLRKVDPETHKRKNPGTSDSIGMPDFLIVFYTLCFVKFIENRILNGVILFQYRGINRSYRAFS